MITPILIPTDLYDIFNVCTGLGAHMSSQAFGSEERILPPDAGDQKLRIHNPCDGSPKGFLRTPPFRPKLGLHLYGMCSKN